MAEGKKIICELRDIYQMASIISRYDMFENWVGGYFGYPNTAEKPEFEVVIRIKSGEEQK